MQMSGRASFFLNTWQNPNFAAPALWPLFRGALVYWKDQPLQARLRKTHGAMGSRENSNTELIWEVSHNLFFRPFELKSCQILEMKEEERQKRLFKRVKGRTISLSPEKSSLCGGVFFVLNLVRFYDLSALQPLKLKEKTKPKPKPQTKSTKPQPFHHHASRHSRIRREFSP